MTNGGFIPTNRVDLGTPTNVGGIPVDRYNKIAKVTEDDVRLSAGLVPGAVYIDSVALDQSIADVKSDMQSALLSSIPAPNHLINGETFIVGDRRTVYVPKNLVIDDGAEVVLGVGSELVEIQ